MVASLAWTILAVSPQAASPLVLIVHDAGRRIGVRVIEDIEGKVGVRGGSQNTRRDAGRRRRPSARRPPAARIPSDFDAVVPVGEFSTGALDEVEGRHIGSSCDWKLASGRWQRLRFVLFRLAGSSRVQCPLAGRFGTPASFTIRRGCGSADRVDDGHRCASAADGSADRPMSVCGCGRRVRRRRDVLTA